MQRDYKPSSTTFWSGNPSPSRPSRAILSPSNKNVGVIRIKNFSGTTADTVAKQMADLQKRGAQQLVLDCRGNPGGLLPGGVDTAALFLPANQPVVFVVNKLGVVDAQSTLAEGVNLEQPLVVLVDGNTASAAEVFAAALQENGRAVLAGAERTFGKGIVQTIRELSDKNGGLAITVARYETPRHNDINKQGIPVDVTTPVDCPKDDAALCLKGAAQRVSQANGNDGGGCRELIPLELIRYYAIRNAHSIL